MPMSDTRPKLPPGNVYFSPTGYSLWAACQRKWAWQYIYGHRDPPGPAAQFGTEVHAEIERYYKQDRPPAKHVRLVSAMLKLLPAPSPYIQAEPQLLMDLLQGEPSLGLMPVKLLGYVDLLEKRPAKAEVVVYDHKTTSGVRYAKTRQDLEDGDPQAVIYQTWAMHLYPRADVSLQWTYGMSKGRKAPWPVKARVPEDVRLEVMDKVREAAAYARQMKKDKPHIEEINPTYGSACTAFGGCPLRERCTKLAEAAASVQTEETMTKEELLAKIKAKKAGVAAAQAEAKHIVDPPKDPVEAAADPVNPPEAAAVPEKAEPDPVPEKPVKKKTTRKSKAAAKAPDPSGADVINPALDAVLNPDGTSKRANPTAAESDAAKATIDPPGKGLHLFVDCYPTKGAPEPIMPLADLLEQAMDDVAQKAEVPHWSLAEYGSGSGGLATEFKKRLPRSGSVIACSFVPETKAVLIVLEQAATVVVRG